MENGMSLSASDVALPNRGDGFGWGGDGGAFIRKLIQAQRSHRSRLE